MDFNFVDFSEGYGASSVADVQDLNKAIEAGASYLDAPASRVNGGALQVESLDASLKSMTYQMKHIKMWGVIPKDQAYNTIEEYNRVNAYGDKGRGFINEGALYQLIFRSRKKTAKEFKKWVTHEVLPSIRKTGKYSIPEKLKIKSTKARNSMTKEWKRH